MTAQSQFVQPPHIAVWLLGLFALPREIESILGDLLEEFSAAVSRSGVVFARKWYWRQTLKTIPQYAAAGFRTAPILTAVAIAGGFGLRKFTGPLVGRVVFAVLEKYQGFFDHHFDTYLFFSSTGLDIIHALSFLIIGFIVAFVARRNEMIATLTLSLIFWTMAVVSSIYVLTGTGDDATLWRLTWYFTDSFVIVIAGVIVRTLRAALSSRRFGYNQ